jgi:glycine cleavage system H lipoate-binding protein
VHCPASRSSHLERPSPSHCPFLQESLAQFCAAAPLPTYVPWSDSPSSLCGHDGHRFCELFLAVAGAGGRGPARRGAASEEEARIFEVDGVPMPSWLGYTPNHLWVDDGDDGLLHIGLDAFVTQLAGPVEHLDFIHVKGLVRPAIVLSVNGVDLSLVFAQALHLVAANTYLRSHLERLASDPYGLGWLFEARREERPGAPDAAPVAGLRRGAAAREWMAAEVRRLAGFVHERILPRRGRGEILLADGGAAGPDLIARLERDEILQLFSALFLPPVLPGRSS